MLNNTNPFCIIRKPYHLANGGYISLASQGSSVVGFPNWSAAMPITPSASGGARRMVWTAVAPQNGYLRVTFNASSEETTSILINGIEVAECGGGEGGGVWTWFGPVSKGDKMTTDRGYTWIEISFVPCYS